VKVELEEVDFEDNEEIIIVTRYGEREQNLVRSDTDRFVVVYQGVEQLIYAYAIPIVIVIALLIFFFFILARRRKKCPHCKHRNRRRSKYCEKCGARLR